jgi:hypothetical protein
MPRRKHPVRRPSHEPHADQALRECIEHDSGYDNLDPKLREDPGLLPLTEDPKERRLKRHTM